MAAHLARHMSATHGRKKKVRRVKRGKRRAVQAKARRRVGRPPGAGSGARALSKLKAYHRGLAAQRDALDAQIAIVKRALDAVG
jgi:hypothetical protein